MNYKKKAISSIIGMVLLIFVTFISFAIFQNWFSNFESKFSNNIQTQVNSDSVEIKLLDANNIYVFNHNALNLSLTNIKINNVSCNLNGSIGPNGIYPINLGNCILNESEGIKKVIISTQNGIFYENIKLTIYAPCTLGNVTINHLQNFSFYNTSTVLFTGGNCSLNSLSRNCFDGTYSGNDSFNYSSCNLADQDITPNTFNFTNQTGVNLSTIITSNTLTPTGYEGSVSVGITGDGTPQLSVAGGAWTTNTTITLGQNISIRLNSSSTGLNLSIATLTLGNYSVNFSVITHGICTLDNITVDHGMNSTFYNVYKALESSSCNSEVRVCNNNTYLGNNTFNYSSCIYYDPYFSNVSLLMHFDGINASTNFTDVKGYKFTANGNARLSTLKSKFNGSSGYFDGSGDYLNFTGTNSNLVFGTGNFTIELWMNFNSLSNQNTFFDTRASQGATPLTLNVFGPGGAYPNTISIYEGVGHYRTSGFTPDTGVWHHIAISRNNTLTKIFVDGIEYKSFTDNTNYNTGNNNIFIGKGYEAGMEINGYIDELRITKGVARYTSNFSVINISFPEVSGRSCNLDGIALQSGQSYYFYNSSYVPEGSYFQYRTCNDSILSGGSEYNISNPIFYDPYFSNVSLLMHFDGINASTNFTDVKGYKFTANGNAQLSTLKSKFNGSSGYFDGSGDYLNFTGTNSNLVFGTGNFTIELWMNFNSLSNQNTFFDTRASQGATPLTLNVFGPGGAYPNTISIYEGVGHYRTSGFTPDTGVWHHVAISRNNTLTKIFVDGIEYKSFTDTANYNTGNNNIFIGKGYEAGMEINGYIDEFRITKGVARYTSNFPVINSSFSEG